MSKLWENEELSENILRIIDQNKKCAHRKKSKNYFYFYENFSLEKYNYSLEKLKAFFNEVLPQAENTLKELKKLGEASVKIKKMYGDEFYNNQQYTLIEKQKYLLNEKLVPFIKEHKVTSDKDFEYVIKKTDSTKSIMEIITVFGITPYELCELYASNKAEEPLNIDGYDVYPVEFLRKIVDFNISKNNITGNMLKLFLMFIYPELRDTILEKMDTEKCKKFMQKFPVCHHIFNEHYHDLFMPYSVTYLPKNQELNIEQIKQTELFKNIKKFENLKNINLHDFLHIPEVCGKVYIENVKKNDLDKNQRLRLLKNFFDTCNNAKDANDLNIIRNAYFTFFENIGFTRLKEMYLDTLKELQII